MRAFFAAAAVLFGASVPASAFEIPTTPAATWTASGVTTGTIPGSPSASPAETGTYFKTTPSGLRMSVTSNGVFPNGSSGTYFSPPSGTSVTGLTPSAAGTNPGVFTTTPVMPAATNPINLLISVDQCRLTATTLTTCSGLGTYRVQLTDPLGGLVPVVAPKIHVTRLGGTVGAMELGSGLLINAGGSTSGIGFASTAAATPTLTVTGGNEFFGNPNVAGTNLNVNCGATATTSAGCGTVQVTGNPSTILLNATAYRTTVAPNIWDNGGDAFFFDMSFDEDFGGAPTSYEGGGTAAGHLLTDLRLGSGVTAENTTTHNGTATGTGLITASPNAVVAPAAAGDTNDGVTFPSLTTANIGASYTVTPTFSGASRAGEICGWIDFDRSGTFTAAEGVCNTFASGATSAPLAWTVPVATTAGPTYARVRITYDTNMSTASFNGLFSSGEVEDYLVHIKPAVRVVKALSPVADTGTFNLSIAGTNFATAIGNGGTTNFRTVYHTDTPEVTVATNVSTAAVTGVVLTETGAGATVLTGYTTASACTNAAGTAVTVGGTALAPSITIPQSITGASANGRAQTITCTLTNTRRPSVTLTKISNGGTGAFTFTGGVGANGWTNQTITTAVAGTGVSGATQMLIAAATATTITETIPAGWRLASVTCTGTGGGTQPTVNTATGAIDFTAAQAAAGSTIACTVTNNKIPTVKVQKATVGGFGGPFSFGQTNLASAPANITTSSGVNPAPAAPTAIDVSAIGTAVELTETPAAGWALTSASCTDANSAVTGKTGSRGTLVGNVLTIPAADVVAGNDYTCVFTNSSPQLSITKTSNGPWSVAQTGASYTLTVTNTATTATSGTITVNDQLPNGIGIRPDSGFVPAAGWTCTYPGAVSSSVATGNLVTCTNSTALAGGASVNLSIPVVVTSAGVGSVTNYASVGGGGDPFNSGAAPAAGAACVDATHCASVATTVSGLPLPPATCTAGTAVNLLSAPLSVNVNLDGGNSTNNATLIASASNYSVGTGSSGAFVADMTWQWNNGVGGASSASTFALVVNGTTYARLTTNAGYAGYATLQTFNGASLIGGGTSLTLETYRRPTTERIWVTLPASVTSISTANTQYNGGEDDFITTLDAIIACAPSITITKDATPDNAQDFAFTTTGTGLSAFSLDDDADGTLPNTRTFASLAPGAYTVTETAVAGWGLGNLVCTDPTTNSTVNLGTRQAAITLNGAETVTCTFTNNRLPTITLTKISNGGAGAFTFTGGVGANGWTDQTITTTAAGAPGTAGATQTLTAANATTTITETIPAGWQLLGVTCTGTGGGTQPTVNTATGAIDFTAAQTAPGSAIACTVTNGFIAYTVAKSASIANISAPGTITYTMTVTNTGGALLTGTTFSDSLVQGATAKTLTTAPTFVSGDTANAGVFDPGEVWVYSATYNAPQADIDNGGTFSNVFTFDTAQSAPQNSNAAQTTVTRTPNLAVLKRVLAGTPTPLVAGQTITFEYVVTNNGNVTISGVAIQETAFNGEAGTGALTPAGGASTLAPGASTTFTALYTVTQTDVDVLQ